VPYYRFKVKSGLTPVEIKQQLDRAVADGVFLGKVDPNGFKLTRGWTSGFRPVIVGEMTPMPDGSMVHVVMTFGCFMGAVYGLFFCFALLALSVAPPFEAGLFLLVTISIIVGGFAVDAGAAKGVLIDAITASPFDYR
jgi:hypothetical protein